LIKTVEDSNIFL